MFWAKVSWVWFNNFKIALFFAISLAVLDLLTRLAWALGLIQILHSSL